MKPLQELIRPNIRALKPYSSARDEYSGADASVFLDANENPYNAPYNRYPDPLQHEVKRHLASIKRVKEDQIFLGNGSDEAIDLAYRAFCRPGIDNVVAIAPTYGMYEVCADINDVEYRKVLLDRDYQFSADTLLEACDENTKLIFLCSPNNPTGNTLLRGEIIRLLTSFEGIVIVDEAYIDFSSEPSFTSTLHLFPNLIILQTLSKAWGCASIRLGMAFASPEIIAVFSKIKYPYNVNGLTQQAAIDMLLTPDRVHTWINKLLGERTRVMKAFGALPCCLHTYPTDANFFLARVTDAPQIYHYLVTKGIIVRNRSNVVLCEGCLRITIGTPEENDALLNALTDYPLDHA